MNILIINTRDNLELFQEIKREYLSESFIAKINSILFDLCNEFNIETDKMFTHELLNEFQKTTVFVINEILLDNIYKYIDSNSIDRFINLINNNTFSKDIYVNTFYITQLKDVIVKYINFSEEETYLLTYILSNRIANIIDEFYIKNSRFLNPILIKIFNTLYDSLGYINVSYYKFLLDQFKRPMFLYIPNS